MGDKKAFEELYDTYSASLYGVIFKMIRDESTAKDVLQESFIKIWKNASKYDPNIAKVFTWMYQIARNTAVDKLRQMKIKTAREIQPKESNVYNIGTQNVKPEQMDLPEQLNKLDEKYRTVVHALFYLGMTQQEASEHLDLPLGTVKTRLRIGMRELRNIFSEVVILTLVFFDWIYNF